MSDDELQITTADMLEIVAGGGNGVEYVDVCGLIETAAKELRQKDEEITTLLARLAPLDDEKLREIAARHVAGIDGHSDDWDRYVDEAKDYIDAIRPHIEAAERERCVKKIEPTGPRPCDCDSCSCGNIGDAQTVAAWDEATANAAAIRSGK